MVQLLGQVAAAGEQGFTVHLRGDPGIGKTRLVEQAMSQARGRGFDSHLMRIREFGSGLGPGLDWATRSLLSALRGEVPDNVYNKAVIPAWLERFGGQNLLG